MIDADLGLFSERRRAKLMITEIRIVSNVSPRLRNRIILVSTNYKQELLLRIHRRVLAPDGPAYPHR